MFFVKFFSKKIQNHSVFGFSSVLPERSRAQLAPTVSLGTIRDLPKGKLNGSAKKFKEG